MSDERKPTPGADLVSGWIDFGSHFYRNCRVQIRRGRSAVTAARSAQGSRPPNAGSAETGTMYNLVEEG